LASFRDLYILRAVRSVFNEEKKLSIAALSQTLPDRLGFLAHGILQRRNIARRPDARR
jgi:hypothetical protein